MHGVDNLPSIDTEEDVDEPLEYDWKNGVRVVSTDANGRDG